MIALHFKHQMIFFLKEMGNVFIQNKKKSKKWYVLYNLLFTYPLSNQY